jgi:Protein of unknown function (DUF4013)
MNVSEIVKDAVRYPFSDWKKILIFGIIDLIATLPFIINRFTSISTTDVTLIGIISIISFLSSFLIRGYSFSIVKSSITGKFDLPEFKNWNEMFINGIKLLIISLVYFIPVFLIILIYSAVQFVSNPSTVINILSGAVIWYFIGGTGLAALSSWLGIWFYIAVLYVIIIVPVMLISIAYMADNNSELIKAFRFREIIDEINKLGLRNLIIWYIATGMIFLVLTAVGAVILIFLLSLIKFSGIMTLSQTFILEDVLIALILAPYLFMYFYRSLALFYRSK